MRLNPDLTRSRDKARPIFEELRRQILAGRFKTGEKLPGSRALAANLGVARGTVNMALAMLAAESLIDTAAGMHAHVVFTAATGPKQKKSVMPELSAWAKRLPVSQHQVGRAFFATGILADEFFPEREWLKAIRESRRAFGILQSTVETSAAGFMPLRESIAAHLKYSRGLDAQADNIVIVNGSMQAIALIAQLLLERGKSAAFENPGFHGIRSAVHATGAESIFCPVDAEGMALPRKRCNLLFVTPASQFPTGTIMSLARRTELLGYATKHNAFIVEDEYDSEFTRLANAPQPLKLIDRDERVIYVGSFSRTMFASLRLGYCLLPDALVGLFLKARQLYDSVPPALADQMAMAAFMASGGYRRHLRRMSRIYTERHRLLLQVLESKLKPGFTLKPSAAGLSLFAEWQGSANDFQRIKGIFAANGLAWQETGRYYAGKSSLAALFGFSHLDAAAIRSIAAKLERIIPEKK
jgi:GntR family transcriptional regulator / MocR family aminotransferase